MSLESLDSSSDSGAPNDAGSGLNIDRLSRTYRTQLLLHFTRQQRPKDELKVPGSDVSVRLCACQIEFLKDLAGTMVFEAANFAAADSYLAKGPLRAFLSPEFNCDLFQDITCHEPEIGKADTLSA